MEKESVFIKPAVNFCLAIERLLYALNGAANSMRRLSEKMEEMQYRPVWLLAIYQNGELCYQAIIPDLEGVMWSDILIDGHTIKVDYACNSGTVFYSLFELLTFDDWRQVKSGARSAATRIY